MILTLQRIIEVSRSRTRRWHDQESEPWIGSDWSNAMAGEAGEACNVVKKIRRHETHAGTSYNTPPMDVLLPKLAEEIADTILYAVLLADHYDLDLPAAVVAKFNLVSEAQNFPERLP